MNSFPYRLPALAILCCAIGTPAFAGRMLNSSAPDELPPVTEREALEATIIEMAEDDDEPTADLELMPESAEDADDESPVAAEAGAPPSRWKWRRSIGLGVSADDNIYLSSGHRESDTIFTLNGDFQLLWGLKKEESFLRIEYAPTVIVFAKHTDANALDQKASLAGQWRLAKLTLGAQVGAQTLSGGDVDVGDRANRSLWQLSLTAKYDYSTKTSFEMSLSPNASNYSKYLDSMEWVESNWIDYQVFPKTRIGAGLTLGYLKPENGDAQTYEEALVRITNPISGKVTLNASGGVQFRQLGGDGGTQTTPVFRIGASYRPFDGTDISLEASRRIYSSASMTGQNFTSTGGTASIRQRLFKRYYARLTGGYEDASYQSTDGRDESSRHDQYFFLRPSVSFAFKKWMSLELYYQYRRNVSTVAYSDFDSNVAGMQATVSF